MKRKDFISYVYTNELLAKSSFNKILDLLEKNSEEWLAISRIMEDELRHHGMAKQHFMNYYPQLQPWHLNVYQLKDTIHNKLRKVYYKNIQFLEKVFNPIYCFFAFLASRLILLLNLNEYNRDSRNLMNITPRSLL